MYTCYFWRLNFCCFLLKNVLKFTVSALWLVQLIIHAVHSTSQWLFFPTFFLSPWWLFLSVCELPHLLPVHTFLSICLFKLSVNTASNKKLANLNLMKHANVITHLPVKMCLVRYASWNRSLPKENIYIFCQVLKKKRFAVSQVWGQYDF